MSPDRKGQGPGTWAEAMARFWTRGRWAILSAVLVVTLVGGTRLPHLGLETDLTALLPSDSPSAQAYDEFLGRFGGFEKVYVVLEHPGFEGSSDDLADRLVTAADLLAEAVADSPEVAGVRSGIAAEEERFFLETVLPRAPLLGLLDHTEIARRLEPEAIDHRVRELRGRLSSPAGVLDRTFAPYDPLGFGEGLATLGGGGGLPVDPLTGAFLSSDGAASLVVITPASAEIDPEAGRRLVAVLEAAEGALVDALGPGIRVSSVGGPLYAAWDEALLRGDLERTLGGSVVACALVLILAFGGLSIPTAALLSVVLALVWTGAALSATVGSVAAVSLGFAAVLVGLGIDYGIHAGVRFAEARRSGFDRGGALAEMVHHSGAAIATSAATTALAFLALSLAHFRPLREVGLMVALGIVAIFAVAATGGGAVLGVLGGSGRLGPLWGWLDRPAEALPALGRRHPRSVLSVVGVVSVLALVGLGRLELDADPSSLRPADHPLLAAEQALASTFGLGSDTATVLVRGDDLGEALARTVVVGDRLRGLGGETGAPVVTTASDLLGPGGTAARTQELASLPWSAAADQLEDSLRTHNLDPVAFAPGLTALRALGEGRDPAPLALASLPSAVGELLRQDADGVWSALRLRLPEGFWAEGPPASLVDELEVLAPGTRVASAAALGVEMRDLARGDLLRLAGAALAAVLLCLALAFRGRPMAMALALVPVSLGTLWACGSLGLVGGRLDLVGLTVVPILLGIGIDDGLHALHGARLRSGETPVADSVRSAGRAMALTTLTTLVGFGSLTLSRVPGLQQGGWLVAGGVLACLLATLVVLPALEALRRR